MQVADADSWHMDRKFAEPLSSFITGTPSTFSRAVSPAAATANLYASAEHANTLTATKYRTLHPIFITAIPSSGTFPVRILSSAHAAKPANNSDQPSQAPHATTVLLASDPVSKRQKLAMRRAKLPAFDNRPASTAGLNGFSASRQSESGLLHLNPANATPLAAVGSRTMLSVSAEPFDMRGLPFNIQCLPSDPKGIKRLNYDEAIERWRQSPEQVQIRADEAAERPAAAKRVASFAQHCREIEAQRIEKGQQVLGAERSLAGGSVIGKRYTGATEGESRAEVSDGCTCSSSCEFAGYGSAEQRRDMISGMWIEPTERKDGDDECIMM